MESEIAGTSSKGGKGREAFRTISEVAEQLDLPQHVLRFWESKFSQIKPLKRGGNRRYYRPDDVTLITAIKKLLHTEGYTIRGVQKLFKAQGVKATISLAMGEGPAVQVIESMSDTSADTAPVAAQDGGAAIDVARLQNVLDRLKAMRARLD